jgi:hypothetical protein
LWDEDEVTHPIQLSPEDFHTSNLIQQDKQFVIWDVLGSSVVSTCDLRDRIREGGIIGLDPTVWRIFQHNSSSVFAFTKRLDGSMTPRSS